MPKYKIHLSWSGYSRGTEIRELEADNELEAKELWYEGKVIEHKVVRDDTESEVDKVEP